MSTLSVLTEDAQRLTLRIRSLLGRRHAMHIGELRMRLGVDRISVQTGLEAMLARGEVERLRPVGCTQEEHDFFRVNGAVGTVEKFESKWFSETIVDSQYNLQLAGKAMACLAD